MYLMIISIVSILISLGLALLPARVAERKGRDFWLWYVYGFFLWLIAMLHAISLPELEIKTNAEVKTNNYIPERLTIKAVTDKIEKKVDINAKIKILSYEILKKSDNQIFIKLDILNKAKKQIKALKIEAKGYDAFKNVVKTGDDEEFKILIQDLNLMHNDSITVEVQLDVSKSDIRELDLYVKQICYDNDIIEDCKEPNYIETCQQEMDSIYRDYALRTNLNAKYYMIQSADYWQCICGNVNTDSSCDYCGMSKNQAIIFSEESIEQSFENYLADAKAEKERLYQKRVAIENQRKIDREIAEQNRILKKKQIHSLIGGSITIIVLVILLVVGLYNS